MSASEGDLEKQKRRHRGPLIGMALVVVFAVGLIGYWVIGEARDGRSPIDPTLPGASPEVTAPVTAPVDAPPVTATPPAAPPTPTQPAN